MKRFETSAGERWRKARRYVCGALSLLLLLALAGCGSGSNGNNGGGGGGNVNVTVSPSAAAAVLNQTLVFSALVSGAPTVDIAATNGAVRASGTVTITTSAAHNLMVGNTVSISGVTDVSFIGQFTVATVPSATTFTFQQNGVDSMSGSGRVSNVSVQWFVNDVMGGDSTNGTITATGVYTAPAILPPPTTATIATMNGLVRTNGVVTVTTTAAHTFVVNQIIQITGVSDATFNVTAVITSVPSTTTFTFTQTNAVNAMSGGGMITSTAVRVKAQSVLTGNPSATAILSLDSGVFVRVLPATSRVGTNEMFQFAATVAGNTNQGVTWSVNDIDGGNMMVGMIDANGVYTAPSTPPSTVMATIAANGAVRAMNVVTITTTANHGFFAGQTVQISGVTDASFNGTVVIATAPSTTTFTYAQNGANAMSGGGTAVLATASVSIRARSVVDPNRSALATVTVVSAQDPALNSISPTVAAQGAALLDVYLAGANFLSTTAALVNGTPVAATLVDDSLIRARIPQTLLESAGTLQIQARRASGFTTGPQSLDVQAVRPALVGTSPDSARRGDSGVTVRFNGGYYSPSVDAEFSGQTRASQPPNITVNISTVVRNNNEVTVTTDAPHGLSVGQSVLISGVTDTSFNGTFVITLVPSTTTFRYAQMGANVVSAGGTVLSNTSSRQRDVSLNMADLSAAGLFSVGVRNSAAAQPVASVNFAVQPDATPAVVGTVNVGMQPASVAVNIATGTAVVANRGSDSLTLIDLATSTPSGPFALPAGSMPTGVGVDNQRNLAVVANNGTDTISVLDLSTGMPVAPAIVSPNSSTGAPLKPFAVGVNSLTGLALIANQSTNMATVVNLTTMPPSVAGTVANVSTGANPQVAIEPRLNWAIITPGGAGTVTIVDLGRRTVVATVSAGVGIRGIGLNTETERALLVDPSSANALQFSVLDQTVTAVALELGFTSAAVNPLTNVGVVLNPTTNQARVIDLQTPQALPAIGVGTMPRAVAIDPVRDVAVIVNEGSNNVSILDLGMIRALQVAEISPASVIRASGDMTDVTLTVTGNGFDASSVVRLDGTALATTLVSARRLTATVPAAMMAAPRRFAVDVLNAGPVQSNVTGFTVIGSVTVGTTPRAVAIDEERNIAVVANSGSNDVSVVDLATGMVTSTIAVGTNPQGVAVLPRAGRAVVTNRSSDNASVIDLAAGSVDFTVGVGSQPIGVAINQDTGTAIVANNNSANITAFSAVTSDIAATFTVDGQPLAVAIDPTRNLAAIVHAGNASNAIMLVNLSPTLSLATRLGGAQLPTGITYDPVSDRFIAVSSLTNNLVIVNPDNFQISLARVGINPTSVAYNFNSSTLVTVNTASNTISVMDFLERRIRAIIPFSGGQRFAVAIHPRTNLGVVIDETNNRVLLLPLPR